MKRSTKRILTTHTGSLPRPPDLIELHRKRDAGSGRPARVPGRRRAAVAETVHKQVEAGIDVVNDGERGKPGYATYIKDRVTGFGGASRGTPQGRGPRLPRVGGPAHRQHPSSFRRPACNRPIAWNDFAAVES